MKIFSSFGNIFNLALDKFMKAEDIITLEVPPLKITDTGLKALEWMEEFKVLELPVVKQNVFVGLINENLVYDMPSPDDKIQNHLDNLEKIFVFNYQHVFDLIKVFVQKNVTLLPVIDEKGRYLGCITQKSLLRSIAHLFSINEQGALFTVEMRNSDYSITELGRMIESNNIKVLSLMTEKASDSNFIRITVKVNQPDISRLLQTFYRYNINVVATYQESEYEQDLKKRWDEFMRYLNI